MCKLQQGPCLSLRPGKRLHQLHQRESKRYVFTSTHRAGWETDLTCQEKIVRFPDGFRQTWRGEQQILMRFQAFSPKDSICKILRLPNWENSLYRPLGGWYFAQTPGQSDLSQPKQKQLNPKTPLNIVNGEAVAPRNKENPVSKNFRVSGRGLTKPPIPEPGSVHSWGTQLGG